MLRNQLLVAVLVLALLAGCSQAETPSEPATPPPASTSTDTPLPDPTATATLQATATPIEEAEATATGAPTDAPSPVEQPTIADPTAEPAPEISAGQALAAEFPTPATASGEVIFVLGRVLDLNGNPLPGVAVEFWQTDSNGVYDHPGDSGTASRDSGFQFYGTSIAGADGGYAFRTVRPGYYEPRPKHIHVKVKQDGRELLTTQFYFEEDRAALENEGMFAEAGGAGDRLILKTSDVDVDGGTVVLTNDLVIDTGSPGSLPPTPAQGEGPYYPVVSVADFDNDLAVP
jgi:protocatechuate 3,4-dioxygenase beta subunit